MILNNIWWRSFSHGVLGNSEHLLISINPSSTLIQVVVSVRVASRGQIEQFKHLLYWQQFNFLNCPWCKRRCPWCNGYRCSKWTRRHEFKSWTRLIAFHIALIPLGKVWIQLFSLQLWENSRTDWVLQPWWDNYSRRRKTLNSNLLNSA